jgi:hypothetical protein
VAIERAARVPTPQVSNRDAKTLRVEFYKTGTRAVRESRWSCFFEDLSNRAIISLAPHSTAIDFAIAFLLDFRGRDEKA